MALYVLKLQLIRPDSGVGVQGGVRDDGEWERVGAWFLDAQDGGTVIGGGRKGPELCSGHQIQGAGDGPAQMPSRRGNRWVRNS